MKEIKITKNEENQRLDKFLLKYMNKASKAFIYKMLRKKRIKYNGKKAEGNELLQGGDSLLLYLSEETIASFMEEKTIAEAERHFGIIYEDDDILAVAKPAGLLTHPEKGDDKDTLIDQVLFYLYQKGQYTPSPQSAFTPALCNRLDRNTSGIVLAGKTLKGVQGLNEAIRNRQVDKYYLTMVKGEVKEAGEISAFLSKEEGKNQVRISKEAGIDGKESITRYRPLAYGKGYTLLEIHLITGKTHQIRAHMQSIGHPVVGDRKYGNTELNQKFRQDFALSNQFLHGARFEFSDTRGSLAYLKGKTLVAPLPKVFRQIVEDIFGENVELE
ncbi:RluA family pseudouridine synthase [Anaerotignum sp.]|uniref:RluA family pseudouridine synthase n=1 Tax=Anaerotignum sp. TaxID=2039241 RepID=UPI0027155ECF|nr:RluA family pseudouridine synthase [Anaerotignum sp.]